MEKKWLRYLSKQNNKELIPLMGKYFNGDIDVQELSNEVYILGLIGFSQFHKELIINEIMNDSEE